MNVKLLVDAIVRQTTVLIAQMIVRALNPLTSAGWNAKAFGCRRWRWSFQ
jgi:hypothetical protein